MTPASADKTQASGKISSSNLAVPQGGNSTTDSEKFTPTPPAVNCSIGVVGRLPLTNLNDFPALPYRRVPIFSIKKDWTIDHVHQVHKDFELGHDGVDAKASQRSEQLNEALNIMAELDACEHQLHSLKDLTQQFNEECEEFKAECEELRKNYEALKETRADEVTSIVTRIGYHHGEDSKYATVEIGTDTKVLSGKLGSGAFSAIFITDPQNFLKDKKDHRVLRDYVKAFAQLQGGTIIFGSVWSTFVRAPKALHYYQSELNIMWRRGGYTRAHCRIGDTFWSEDLRPSNIPSLESTYSTKSLFVRGNPPESRLYVNDDEQDQSSVVYEKYGKGHIGYLGDVNNETGTIKILLAMCGLVPGTSVPEIAPHE
ncbi:hypothetical protein MMC25_005631 [Agyrium rufum]|nr:hypothetical protein [Agyrium rufum]